MMIVMPSGFNVLEIKPQIATAAGVDPLATMSLAKAHETFLPATDRSQFSLGMVVGRGAGNVIGSSLMIYPFWHSRLHERPKGTSHQAAQPHRW